MAVKRKPVLKKKTNRRKKSKIYIPADKMLGLCLVIVAGCTILLFVNTLLESGVRKDPSVGKSEQTALQSTSAPETAVSPSSAPIPPVKPYASVPEKKTAPSSVPAVPPAGVSAESQPQPKVQPQSQTQTPAHVYSSDIPEIPFASNHAKLVFVFDDAGQNLNHLEKFVSLPFPVTIAVLPKLPYSKESADRIRASGKEVMLHQPMQAVNLNVNPGPGAVTPEMPVSQINAVLRVNIEEIGPVSGINNHEGSLICENESRIGAIMQTVSDMGMYFLDSRTTSQTRVPQAAMSLGLSYYERNIFLDNTKDRAEIIGEIMKGISIANKNGAVIMIGHVWSADILPGILMEMYPLLANKGYVFSTVSDSGAKITP